MINKFLNRYNVYSVSEWRADEIERSLADQDIKSIIDVDDFPRLVVGKKGENWKEVFRYPLNDDEGFQNQLWLIKTCRDQSWAHPPEGDAESEGTRAYLFLIADVLRKIKKPDKQSELEAIRDKLFSDDTAERLEKAEEDRILDRRDVDKQNYLLNLLEQKQPIIIYVQSEEMVDLLLERVVPEKADVIERHGERTSEAEEAEIFEKLEKGELIAVVSNTAFSTLTPSHGIEHFVFCHLVPGLDEFFKQCEPAFTSEKNTCLHLIYNSEQDIKGLAQKYPDREALEKLYPELRKLAGTNGDFIRPENVYNELDIAKPGIETGLAIFEELQLLERNDEGIRLLPPAGKKLDASEIYRRGEQLKNGAAGFQVFQFEQSIEQIWEALLKELNVDNEQILEASSVYEVRAFPDAIEDSGAQSEPSTDAVENDSKADDEVSEVQSERPTETVENDNTVDGEDAEAKQPLKSARANAKVTEEQVREIRSRNAAGESYSKLAKEFDLSPAAVRNMVLRNTWKDVE